MCEPTSSTSFVGFFCSNLSLYPSLLPPSPNLPVCLLAGHTNHPHLFHSLTHCVTPPVFVFLLLVDSMRFQSVLLLVHLFNLSVKCVVLYLLPDIWTFFFPFLPVVTNSDQKLRTHFFLVKAKPINNIRLVYMCLLFIHSYVCECDDTYGSAHFFGRVILEHAHIHTCSYMCANTRDIYTIEMVCTHFQFW